MLNPPFPEAFSTEVAGLGIPKRYFPIKKLNRIGSLVASFIFCGGAVLVFVYGIYIAYVAYQKHGLALIEDKLTVPVIIAFGLFLLGVAAAWSAYVNWNRGVGLYERGFAFCNRKGIWIWRWENIGSLTSVVTRHYTNGIYSGTTHVYTFLNKQNERLVINDAFAKVEELVEAIEKNIFPLLYERTAQQYNDGQVLAFGSVTVSKAGIQIGKKTYPWTDVKEVSIHQGILKVTRKDGGWFSGANASAAAIPNLRVLLTIINQVVGLKAVK